MRARTPDVPSSELDRALANGEFAPCFQPKIELATGTITGVEALARWNHPSSGLSLPAEFLPLIESLGRLPAFTQAIITSSIRQAACWRDQGCKLNLSVNLSLSALHNPSFCNDTQTLLAAARLTPEDITFEIIENAGMGDVAAHWRP